MTTRGEDQDQRITEMLHAVADAIVEQMSEIGFVLILSRSSDDEEDGSLLSLSNLSDDDVVQILEMVLARRRALATQNAKTTRTVQ